MRLGGCVAERRTVAGCKAAEGDPVRKQVERNAGPVWRVFLSTGQFAIPETIDARRGIGEV
jgi:hypothetical protein